MNATTLEADQERSFCQRYWNRIRAYGLCHLRDTAAAEDHVDNLDKYVFGTCRNTAMDMRRGSARHRRIATAAATALPDSYEPRWELADRSRLDQCLARLEARARAVVLATFVDERDADDVGRSMSLSAGNVRVIRHRALAHLQRCMGGEQPS
jgi:RNA polymerase sigma-70 factor (ECF subfamily)